MSGIRFSSSAILHTIREKHVYKDELSVEKSTGVTKRKYKLAAKWPDSLKSQNIRMFFVSTSNPDSVKTRTTIEISGQDYITCVLPQLKNNVSYYDLTKREFLSGAEVKAKVDSPNNGFSDVAEITDDAFRSFLDKTYNLHIQGRPPLGVDDIVNIASSVVDESLSEQLLRDLHLLK